MSWVWGTGIRGEPAPMLDRAHEARIDRASDARSPRAGRVAHFLGELVEVINRPVSGQDFYTQEIISRKSDSPPDINHDNLHKD